MINSTPFKHDSNTQVSFRNPNVITLQGNAGGLTIIGGTDSGNDLTLSSSSHATKDRIFFGSAAASSYDEVNDRLGIGVAAPVYKLDVAITSTATSGNVFASQFATVANPASTSTGTFRGITVTASVPDGNTSNITTLTAAQQFVQHRGDGVITNLSGVTAQVFTGPLIGAAADLASYTTMRGFLLQARDNSTAISSTRMVGGEFDAGPTGTNTITTVTTAHFVVRSGNSGSGAGTVTNFYGGRFTGTDGTGIDTLSAGTITNAIMVEIGDWNSGPTYTNPPEAFKLVDQTASNARAIHQVGTDDFNIFAGISNFGTDANATHGVDIQTSLGFKRTTVADIAYTVLVTDLIVAYTTLTAARTVTLPAAATAGARKVYIIKDEAGTAATNNITIDGNASEVIDGSTTKIINTNYGSVTIYCNGTAWFSI